MTVVTIKLRNQPHSARKLRPLISLYAGKKLTLVLDQSSVTKSDAAKITNKALKMAKAAAEQKHFDVDKLIVTEIFASQGPKIKRMRPNARGRSNKYIKHLAHLTIKVKEESVDKIQSKAKVEKPTQSRKNS